MTKLPAAAEEQGGLPQALKLKKKQTDKEKWKFMRQRISNGKKQTFTITAPGATNVLLAGDFTHWEEWPIPMLQETIGVWKTTVELAPGTYRYRFIVDGQWRDDPNCAQRAANPFGTQDAIRQIA